jgi:FAD binding domain
MSRFYLHVLRLVGFLPILAIAAGLKKPADICQRIDARIPGRISYPGDSVYSDSQSSYYTAQERDLSPGCIFRPQKTSEVSQFVKLIHADGGDGNASYSTPQFAIRGGGHTLFSGAANIAGGITIDMRAMDSLVLSEDRKMVSIGGGGIWSHIYPQLVPHNLTVLGGRIPGIAIGGFATGGTYSNADGLVMKCSLSLRRRKLPVKETRLELRQHIRLRGGSCQR